MRQIFTLMLLGSFTFCRGQDSGRGVATVPPMGWNSYDCYGATVTESEVEANARYEAKYLKAYGWNYIVVDFCWFYPNPPDSKVSPPQQSRLPDGSYSPQLAMDRYGRLLPVIRKFPSAADGSGFKALADKVHSLGLKFGIHIMRGIPRQAVRARTPVLGMPGVDASMICDTASTCKWLNAMYGLDMKKHGAQAYLNSLLRLYASWGVDFIKVDDISRPYHAAEIEGYRKAIAQCGRPIVLSLSPGATPLSEAAHVTKYANMWRLADDFWDSWKALKPMFRLAGEWAPYAGRGHWPNLDMIPIGKISKRGPVGPERYSRFSPAEKRTMMTLWCMARSPLILGGNLPENTREDLSWETNKEVLAVDQKGRNAHELYRNGGIVVWVSGMPAPGVWNIAIFNLGDKPEREVFSFSKVGITRAVSIRDLWKHQELGKFSRTFSQLIQPHDATLFRIKTL